MNLRNAAGAAVSRFAHLSGLASPKSKAEGDKPEDDKDDEKEKPATEDDKDDDAKAKAKDDDADPNDDDDRKDQDGEEDDKEPKDKDAKAAYAAGFRDAQARAASIFGHAAAAGNPALAAELAFNTNVPAAQAVALLSVGGVSPRSGLASRMASTKPISVGADHASDIPASKGAEASQQASRILAAARAAGGKF